MATRVVRDCDRCGKPDIGDRHVLIFGGIGNHELDICDDCRSHLFGDLIHCLDGQMADGFVDGIREYRNSTAKYHGATPHDMRP